MSDTETKTPAAKGKGTKRKASSSSKKEKEPKAKKAKVDKGPSKGKTPYMIYTGLHRERIKKENPDATFGELNKLFGAAWNEASKEERAKCEKQSAKDKQRYNEELEAWLAAGNKLPEKKPRKSKAGKKAKKEADDGEEAEEEDA
jgi:hypothetical protein